MIQSDGIVIDYFEFRTPRHIRRTAPVELHAGLAPDLVDRSERGVAVREVLRAMALLVEDVETMERDARDGRVHGAGRLRRVAQVAGSVAEQRLPGAVAAGDVGVMRQQPVVGPLDGL